MIKTQHTSVQSTHCRHDVQQQVELINGVVKAKEEDGYRKNHLNDRHRELKGHSAPDEVTAVKEGVGCPQEQVPQKHDKVSVIVVADAATGKHTVVIPLKDAGVAGGAVPGSRRRQGLADGAQPPAVRGSRRAHRHYAPLGAGVAEHGIRKITYDV